MGASGTSGQAVAGVNGAIVTMYGMHTRATKVIIRRTCASPWDPRTWLTYSIMERRSPASRTSFMHQLAFRLIGILTRMFGWR